MRKGMHLLRRNPKGSATFMRCCFVVICTFIFCSARAQMPVNVLNAKEQAHFGTLVKLAACLRKEKTAD